MCVKVVNSKATTTEQTFPSLPATAAVKKEPNDEPPMKKVKYEAEDYDDWLDDVVNVKTEREKSTTSYELINTELEKYDAEPQIRGDPLQWWKSREASMPILAEVARSVLCIPGSSVPSETIPSCLYGRIFGYSFEGMGPIIEGDFDPKTELYWEIPVYMHIYFRAHINCLLKYQIA